MAKVKSGTTRRKPRARPQTPRKRAKRPAAEPKVASIPPATVHENESEDQLGAYGNDQGETDILQP
jgi:hypothetical protein